MSTTPTDSVDDTSIDEPAAPTAVRSTRTFVIGLFGVAIAAVGVRLAADGLGPAILALVAVGLAWYRLDELYAIALGHAVFLSVVGSVSLEPALLVAEIGLLVVLLAPAVDADAPVSFVGAALLTLGGLIAVAAAGYGWSGQLWIGAGVLLGTLVLSDYALYRYELVHLGLVEDGESA